MTPFFAMLLLSGGGFPTPDAELVDAARRPREVDVSSSELYGMRWRRPVVRTGMFRSVGVSFGVPAVSLRHRLVLVGQGEGEVRALALADGGTVWRFHHSAPFEASSFWSCVQD